MKRQMPVFLLILLFLVFNASIAATIFSGKFIHGGARPLTTYSGTVVAFVTSTVLIRQQRVRTFLATRPVLWFLFLFNAAAAAALYLTLAGLKGIAATVLMGLVSLGAGTGLLRSPKKG